jgi:DNA-binding HxlR family transcriptional regulator
MDSRPFGTIWQSARDDPLITEERAILADVEWAAALLGQRWKASLIYLLGAGPSRYNALARRLGSITPKMLTQQLRALERDGMVHREVYRGGRRHVEYSLTPLGHGLRAATEVFATAGCKARPRIDTPEGHASVRTN